VLVIVSETQSKSIIGQSLFTRHSPAFKNS